MTGIWALAAIWFGLALIASLLSIWLRVSTALSEIIVGTIAQLIIGAAIGSAILGTDESWIKVLSGTGAIVLTFLAGAELDPNVFKRKWKEATAVGLAGFFFPFFGCAAAAYFLLGWDVMPSWLGGVALSTTSVAVVYAVMLEFGLNKTEYGKTVLAACLINDLGTACARLHLRALYHPHPHLRRRRGGEDCLAPLVDSEIFQALRQPPVGARNQIPTAVSVRPRSLGRLGRQRSGASGLYYRHGARRHRGARTTR
jgi:Sodium/hydrogen exchanger family